MMPSPVTQKLSIADELFEPAPPRTLLEVAAQPAPAFWRVLLFRLLRDKRAVFGSLVILILIIAALLGPMLWPVDPAQQILGAAAQGPTRAQHAELVSDAADVADMPCD